MKQRLYKLHRADRTPSPYPLFLRCLWDKNQSKWEFLNPAEPKWNSAEVERRHILTPLGKDGARFLPCSSATDKDDESWRQYIAAP